MVSVRKALFLAITNRNENIEYSVRIMYNFCGDDDMEKRFAKMNISAAGGTAAEGAKTYKLTIPSGWAQKLGVKENNRQVELTLDGDRIIIKKTISLQEFACRCREKNHKVKTYLFYNGQQLCSRIVADFTERTLCTENTSDNLVKTAFGKNTTPTWDDFNAFLEERCVPRQRDGIREYLEALGLDEYDPAAIVEKTQGRMAEDQQWLEIIDG